MSTAVSENMPSSLATFFPFWWYIPTALRVVGPDADDSTSVQCKLSI